MWIVRKLDRIERKLDWVIQLERMIMADEAALDQAIADLGSNVDELQAAAQSIIDKVSNMPEAPDLSDEIATIQGFGEKVSSTTTAISDAVAGPAPAPTEPGTTEPAPEPGDTSTEENPPA